MQTAVAALLGGFLGFAINFAARLFPLRVLDETLSELVEARREAEMENCKLDAALKNMSQGLSMYDASDRLVVSNRRYREIYGLRPEQTAPGTPFEAVLAERETKMIHAAGDEFFRDFVKRMHNGETGAVELGLQDGRVIYISYQPMPGGGWIAIHDDVTERRQAELRRAEAEREAEQSRQQEQIAAAANRAKSSFLATMSHEIRTPMNAVLGLASALLDSGPRSDQRQSLEIIQKSGETLLRLLNDILDLSKLESGRFSLEEIAFSPRAVVGDMLEIFEPQAAAKGLAFRIEYDPVIPSTLVGDGGRLRQIAMNLISNAMKFTASGEVVFGVKCLERGPTRVTLEGIVRDTGIGIAPEKIGRLFSEFSQVDSSINRRFGGTGLGLAIVKGIVDQMGGAITVESTLGVGTTLRFAISLPWSSKVVEAGTDDPSAIDALRCRIASLRRPMRILIAEDNQTNQLVMRHLLKDFDVQAQVVANGVEAVRAVETFEYDVVLMDMCMPEMDGVEATRAIRSHGGTSAAVPIIGSCSGVWRRDVSEQVLTNWYVADSTL
ncbi:hypothetical protein CH341_28665, partial [Rhodoplanes roseus]